MAEVLERERELASLSSLIAGIGAGGDRTVVLEGPPGLGKSTLIGVAERLGRDRDDLTVLAFCCGELERQLPWAGAVGLLGSALAALDPPRRRRLLRRLPAAVATLFADATPSGAPGGSAEVDRHAMLGALTLLTRELAAGRPLLIVVDDAHWCDRPTLNLLVYLQRRLGSLPAGLLLATRPCAMVASPQRAALEMLMAADGTDVLTLAALGSASVRALLAEHGFTDVDAEFCDVCREVTGGNPFFVRELVRELRERGAGSEPALAPRELSEINPPAVQRSLLIRLDRLPVATAGPLAAAAAVLGDGATFAHAARLAELDPAAAVDGLDALVHAELLAAGEPLRFAHPLVRTAIYSEIPPVRRAAAHARAADLLASDHAAPELVALHLLHAPRLADGAVVDRLRAGAARALAQGAPRAAMRYLRRALQEPPPPAARADVLAELAAAETAFGDGGAVAHLAEAVQLAVEPGRQARLLLELGWAQHHATRFGDAADAFLRGRELLADRDRDLADALEAGYLVAATLDSERAADANARIAAIESDAEIRSPAHRMLLAQVLFMRAVSGAPRETIVELAQRIWSGGRLLREEGAGSHTLWHVIGALSWAEAYDSAVDAIEQTLVAADASGLALAHAQARYARAWPRLWTGQLRGAEQDARAAIEIWDGGLETYLAGAIYYHGLACIELGEITQAQASLQLALPITRWEGTGMAGFVHALQGALHMHHGHAEQALESQLACAAVMDALAVTSPAVMPWRSQAARAMRLTGDIDGARALAAEELARARACGVRRAIGTARATVGLCTPGEAGVAELSAAAAELRECGARLEQTRTLVDLGAAIRRDGRPREARAPLREALAVASECDAVVLAQRADTELRAAGGRGRRTGAVGPAALTASERRVAELAADGHTNRHIARLLQISVKAVEWHLHQSYRKLDIRGRAELSGALGS